MDLTNCNASTLNPAYTGWNPGWTAGIGYKTMSSPWNNETVNIYGEYGKGAHAGGLNIFPNVQGIGTLTSTQVTGKYAWHYCKEKWGFRLGTGISLVQNTIDFSKLTFSDMIDPRTGFVKGSTAEKPVKPINFASLIFGFWAYYKNIYISAAAHNINQPNESFYHSTGPGTTLPVRYFMQVGGYININENICVQPSIKYNTQSIHNFIDAEVQLSIKRFALGVSKYMSATYQNTNTINLMLGYVIKDKFKIAYKYCYYSNPYASNELCLVYQMKAKKSKHSENALAKNMRKFL